MTGRVEIYTSARNRSGKSGCIGMGDTVTIRVGLEVATLTAGEWGKLIANPQKTLAPVGGDAI